VHSYKWAALSVIELCLCAALHDCNVRGRLTLQVCDTQLQALTADGALLLVVATPLALYVLKSPPGAATASALVAAYAHVSVLGVCIHRCCLLSNMTTL
jgi:hypothetical protein